MWLVRIAAGDCTKTRQCGDCISAPQNNKYVQPFRNPSETLEVSADSSNKLGYRWRHWLQVRPHRHVLRAGCSCRCVFLLYHLLARLDFCNRARHVLERRCNDRLCRQAHTVRRTPSVSHTRRPRQGLLSCCCNLQPRAVHVAERSSAQEGLWQLHTWVVASRSPALHAVQLQYTHQWVWI